MRYLSIDTETTGLNPKEHQVIEFGAVIEDTVHYKTLSILPVFHCMINYDQILGSAYALQLNYRILKELAKPTGNVLILKPHEVGSKFLEWLIKNEFVPDENGLLTVNVAGKNFSQFDMKFLEKLPKFFDRLKFKQRIIDPAILFMDWKKDDCLPSLKECKERCNIDGEVTHNAVDDALDVIKILRTKYY